MKPNPRPIADPHKRFAQAVVKLAREHGVSTINLQFRLGSSRFFQREEDDPEWLQASYVNVTAQWHEGRHGDGATISLRAEAQDSVKELPAQAGTHE